MSEPLIETPAPANYQRLSDLIDTLNGEWKIGSVDGELITLRRLTEQIEQAQARAVARARSEGLSWAQIAALLKVSKQAVHKRYGSAPSTTVDQPDALNQHHSEQ